MVNQAPDMQSTLSSKQHFSLPAPSCISLLALLLAFVAAPTFAQKEKPKYKPEVIELGRAINSEQEELMPVPTPDGQTLFYLRGLNPENMGGPRAGQDIWKAERGEDGNWEPAVNLGPPLNTTGHNSVCGFSKDLDTLYVMNVYLRKGRMKPGISYSVRQSDGTYGKPEELKIKGMTVNRGYLGAHMDASGDVLLLSYDSPQSRGREDIHVSFRVENGKYSSPINLGNQINTRGFEISPFLAPDKKTLFFSSNTHNSIGSADIFVSTRLDDSWTNWSPPENLGPMINSDQFEGYFYLNPDSTAYFAVADPFGDEGDIFFIPKFDTATFINYDENDYREPEPAIAENQVPEPEQVEQEIEPVEPEPVQPDQEPSNDNNATAGVVIKDDDSFDEQAYLDEIERLKRELAEKERLLALSNRDQQVQQQVIETHPLFDNKKRSINNDFPDVNFSFASYQLDEKAKERLNKMVTYLNENKNYKVELLGHTDTVDNDLVNIILGGRRAWMAKQYVVSKGIDPRRVIIMSMGRHKPKVENTSSENRAINRRVEIYVVEE